MSTARSLLGSHNVSDFITLVDGELPMDMYSALQKSEKHIISVMRSIFYVKNLTASEFLWSAGNTAKLASDEVKDKTEVITFFDLIEISNHQVRIVILCRGPFASSVLSGCLNSTTMTQQRWYTVSDFLLRGNIFHPRKQQEWHIFLDPEERTSSTLQFGVELTVQARSPQAAVWTLQYVLVHKNVRIFQ